MGVCMRQHIGWLQKVFGLGLAGSHQEVRITPAPAAACVTLACCAGYSTAAVCETLTACCCV